MADTVHYAQPHPEEHPEKHEHSDVRVRPLMWLGIGFVIFAILVHIGLYLLLFAFENHAAEQNRTPLTALTPSSPSVREGVPVLQGVPPLHANTPAQDWQKMKADNRRAINSYGRNEQAATARIPIERAMELSLERGIYKSAAPAGQPQQQTQRPTTATAKRPAAEAKGGHDAPAPH